MTARIEQTDVARWFDETYRKKGFQYLRPAAAYPIYLQLLDAGAGGRLLDVGCGPGLLLKAALDRGLRATGLDISAEAIAIGHRFVPDADLRVGNAEAMPFADGSFDFVTGIGVLERFFDRGKVLAEIRRVAAPGARFCFMVRNSRAIGWKVWRQWLGRQNHAGHQDAMGLEEWRALFEANGFVVDDVLVDQWQRQRLRYVLRGFRHPKALATERVARSLLPMRFAYEYIFLMHAQG